MELVQIGQKRPALTSISDSESDDYEEENQFHYHASNRKPIIATVNTAQEAKTETK